MWKTVNQLFFYELHLLKLKSKIMKRIILGLVLFFNLVCFGQEKIEMTKDGLTNTEQIIKLDSLTAKEIYSRINKYIQKNYANPEAVSKGNVENEFISFNGIKKDCISEKVMVSTFYSDIEYYINIDIKDGKIKYSMSKLIQIKRIYDKTYPVDLLTMTGSGYFKSDGSIRNQYVKLKVDVEKVLNEITKDLVSSIKENKKSDW